MRQLAFRFELFKEEIVAGLTNNDTASSFISRLRSGVIIFKRAC